MLARQPERDPEEPRSHGTRGVVLVELAVERQLATLPRAETARASWRDFGALIVVRDLSEGTKLVDRIAPERATSLSAERLHALIEAGRLAFGVRDHLVAERVWQEFSMSSSEKGFSTISESLNSPATRTMVPRAETGKS